jgi:hypothetical protein
MSAIKSEVFRGRECEEYRINILALSAIQLNGRYENEELEKSILTWFSERGIHKANPEEEVQAQRNSLKVVVREKVRKMSVPDEGSLILRRRSRDNICVTI